MKEKTIEEYLKAQVESRLGMCIKLNTTSERGFPDRLCILPGGYIMFVETKRPKGGKVSKYQNHILSELNNTGARAYLANTKESVDSLMKRYDVRMHHLMECYEDTE
ncbi:MAG: VRR-NUC domain-containing protein [Roseburia sp.]|nr:hypothetical protein [Anaeroplasma bactoclasticum]MCM1195505.1 VRR-NUC domain-containing protein [Roseburia sp.]MCM1556884.1 hypothetical protein [Anaeroplasma bactoclasticum]